MERNFQMLGSFLRLTSKAWFGAIRKSAGVLKMWIITVSHAPSHCFRSQQLLHLVRLPIAADAQE